MRARLAANLKQIRKSRGLSTYQLAAELERIGWPIHQTGIVKMESGERRSDPDDVLALAVVLNCSPNRLLLPEVRSVAGVGRGEPLVGDVTAVDYDAWAWATGKRPLVRLYMDGVPRPVPTGAEVAAFQAENQPDLFIAPAPASPEYRQALLAGLRQMLSSGTLTPQTQAMLDEILKTAVEGEPDGEG